MLHEWDGIVNEPLTTDLPAGEEITIS